MNSPSLSKSHAVLRRVPDPEVSHPAAPDRVDHLDLLLRQLILAIIAYLRSPEQAEVRLALIRDHLLGA